MVSKEGCGNYNVESHLDRATTFGYDSSGHLARVLFYRPGQGIISIQKANNPGNWLNRKGNMRITGSKWDLKFVSDKGIGGYDILSERESVFAFDYNHSGKSDHLVFYRPGSGIIYVVRREGTDFVTVFRSQDTGIAYFDLCSEDDQAFALDWESNGKMDHIVIYRSGTGILWMLVNLNSKLIYFYQYPAGGADGTWDLSDKNDRCIAFDWNRSGKLDSLLFYRPGKGKCAIFTRDANGRPKLVLNQLVEVRGVAGHGLDSKDDRIFPFDADGVGTPDDMVIHRSGRNGKYHVAVGVLRPGEFRVP